MSERYYKSLLELRKVLDYDLLKEIERLVINRKNTKKWIKKFVWNKKLTYKETFHLKALNLNGNKIVGVGPLASLGQLQSLGLNGNQIVDVGPLASLGQLQKLCLHGNNIVEDHHSIKVLKRKGVEVYYFE